MPKHYSGHGKNISFGPVGKRGFIQGPLSGLTAAYGSLENGVEKTNTRMSTRGALTESRKPGRELATQRQRVVDLTGYDEPSGGGTRYSHRIGLTEKKTKDNSSNLNSSKSQLELIKLARQQTDRPATASAFSSKAVPNRKKTINRKSGGHSKVSKQIDDLIKGNDLLQRKRNSLAGIGQTTGERLQ